MSPAPKMFDIVVYGATGFTGQLIVEYLNQQAPKQGTSWAIAGRSRAKLEQTATKLGVAGVAIIVADSSDEEALREMCKQTRTVITVVGPFNIYGKQLVKVAAEEGTHYLDLTGEAHFVKWSLDNHSKTAQQTGALMIPASGFDSIPSDLCTFLASQALKGAAEGVEVGEVVSRFSAKGTPSGGTIATALDIIEKLTPAERKANSNPYALSPVQGKPSRALFLASSSTFQRKREWGGFWFMASANTAIVNRTFGLLQTFAPKLAYGKNFTYRETFAAKSRLAASLNSAVLFLSFATLILFPPARWALRKYGPQSGGGPSKEAQESGWFKVATTAKSSSHPQLEARATVKAKGDPGYKATSRMIVESALAIVHDWDRLPELARKGGILTPATALGPILVERLEKTGEFEFTTEVGGKKL